MTTEKPRRPRGICKKCWIANSMVEPAGGWPAIGEDKWCDEHRPPPPRPIDVCVDCWVEFDRVAPKGGWRPAPEEGPRCATHHHALQVRPLKRPKDVCIDCWKELDGTRPAGGWRPCPPGAQGPRCLAHWRAVKKARRKAAHKQRLEANFGMPDSLYWALYAFQGGKCFVCRVATGATKNLAVDHDHECDAGHPKEQGCPRCWRALLCGRCNQAIGFLGVEALLRAVALLVGDTPAKKLFVLEVINEGSFDLGDERSDGAYDDGDGLEPDEDLGRAGDLDPPCEQAPIGPGDRAQAGGDGNTPAASGEGSLAGGERVDCSGDRSLAAGIEANG